MENERNFTAVEMVNYANARNKQRGRNHLEWLIVSPQDDPSQLIGIDRITNTICGPNVNCGKRYKIFYQQPMILPFQTPDHGNFVLHIAEIEGTLDGTGTRLTDVKAVACSPNDYSIRESVGATHSIFRLCSDDKIEEVNI